MEKNIMDYKVEPRSFSSSFATTIDRRTDRDKSQSRRSVKAMVNWFEKSTKKVDNTHITNTKPEKTLENNRDAVLESENQGHAQIKSGSQPISDKDYFLILLSHKENLNDQPLARYVGGQEDPAFTLHKEDAFSAQISIMDDHNDLDTGHQLSLIHI